MTLRLRLGACAILTALSSCGGSNEAPNDAPNEGGLANDGGVTDGPDGLDVAFQAGGEAGPTHACSADLRTVLDPAGKPIATCLLDQGCLNGACVGACDAAAGSKSTIGCEYYAHQYAISMTNSDQWWNYGDIRGGCYAAVVVNTWPTPAKLTVSRAGKTFPVDPFARVLATDATGSLKYDPYPTTGLPPNTAAVLFLSYDTRAAGKGSDVPCPAGVTAATTIDSAIHVTGYNDAFNIGSDRPVTAYQVYPWGGAPSAIPSATLLYPSSAWGTNYVAPAISDQYAIGIGVGNDVTYLKPFVTLVASEDTMVTLVAKVDIAGDATNGVAAVPKNTPATYSIGKGQYLQLLQRPNLGGTIVSSTRPVGMFIGSQQFRLPVSGIGDGDNQGQMVPPIRAQGWEYVGASYDLPSATPWQLVGAMDGTTLTYDPAPPLGAPTTINLGDVLEFSSQTEFTVRSQGSDHPFYMAVYKRSDDNNTPSGPDFVNILPPVQYRSQYVFVTDPTYKTTALVFVHAKGAGDVRLDCVGKIDGFKPIGSGAYEVARVVFGKGNTCKNGPHQATSDGAFGITVWGWSFAASYGYPAGGNSFPVNNVIVPPVPR